MAGRTSRAAVWASLLAGLVAPVTRAEPATLTALRFSSFGDVTRVAIETTGEFTYRSDRLESPARLFLDIPEMRLRLADEQKGMQVIPVGDKRLKQIRVAQTQPGVVRIVFDLEASGVTFTASQLANPQRMIVELRMGSSATSPPLVSSSGAVATPSRKFDVASVPRSTTRPAVSQEVPRPPEIRPSERLPRRPPAQVAAGLEERLSVAAPPPATPLPAAVIDLPRREIRETADASKTTLPPVLATPAKRNAAGERSLIRALGLKIGRVVIDPGHGGHDTGTIGPTGLSEKDLVLDIGKRLGALVADRLGSEVEMTRSDDTFIALERRPEFANEKKADLFISIHANSSSIRSVTGVETFYLNFTTSPAALDLAARENATAQKSVHELQELLQKIALKDKVEESREFAARVQSALMVSLSRGARTRDRGVKKAPFVVLIGATMPSILAEIGFVSNPRDEALLKRPDHRQKIAEALYKGLEQYAKTLSHFQVAQRGAP